MKSVVVRPAIATGLLLLVPLVFTVLDRNKPPGEGVAWGVMDFVVMGALLLFAGIAYEFFASRLSSRQGRAVLGLGIAAVVFAIWVELAVGGITQLARYAAG